MTAKTLGINQALSNYIYNMSHDETSEQKTLREQTSKLELANMQIAPEQAKFFQFLLKLIDAKYALEIGTFTGYSALAIALSLPADGKLICCDINPTWTKYSKPAWEAAGVADKISLEIAPALETIERLLRDSETPAFDFIFIDADKTNYEAYYQAALQLISTKGIIAIDNIFWDGKVLDEDKDRQTQAIYNVTKRIKEDERVDATIVPIGDGVCLVRRKTEHGQPN